MALVEDIDRRLREAMLARDLRTADVLRMLKTRVTERRTSEGFKGEVTDAVVQDVIAGYAKQMDKAIGEYRAAGERGREMVEQLEFEVGYCRQFLPQKIGEDESRELVRKAIADTGASAPKEAGKVVGAIMKSAADRGRLDAALLKRLAEELLGG